MKLLEIGLLIVLLCVIIALPYDIPGMTMLLVLLISLLSILYFYSGLSISRGFRLKGVFPTATSGTSKTDVFIGLLGGLGASAALMGILFKVMHWPGAGMEMMLGLLLSLISLIGSLFKFRSDTSGLYKALLKRLSVIVIIGIYLMLFPLRWDMYRYQNHPSYLKALFEWRQDPQNPNLKAKFDAELMKLEKRDSLEFSHQ
ncbi:MAG: hypothetical protein GC180_12210 [Bacteroidetes bacterium]|nr:hypothetical protein [Bacteroidota bacterium]